MGTRSQTMGVAVLEDLMDGGPLIALVGVN